MKAARGKVLVRPVVTQETLPGGRIVIPEPARDKFASHQMQVVDVGEPEVCDDEDCRRDHARLGELGPPSDDARIHLTDYHMTAGAWVYVKPRSLVDACHPTDKLYIVRQDDVMAVLTASEG